MPPSLLLAIGLAAGGLPKPEGCVWSTTLSADHTQLRLHCGAHSQDAPVTEPEQAGYGQPQVAPDGASVGWLALTRQCCTSYPLPTALLIHDAVGVRHRFEMVLPAWQWHYSADGQAVVYRQSTTHGAHPETYTQRRMVDGALLARYTCYPPDPDQGETAATLEPAGPIPAWMQPLLHTHHRDDPQAALAAGTCP